MQRRNLGEVRDRHRREGAGKRERMPRAHAPGWIRGVPAYYGNLSKDFEYLGIGGPVSYAIPIALTFALGAASFQGLDRLSRITLMVVGVGGSASVYLFTMTRLVTYPGRVEIFERLRKYGAAILTYYLFMAIANAIAFFAWVTLLFANERWVQFQGSSSHIIGPRPIALFYTWHFVNSIPLIDLDTVKLQQPLHYTEVRIGLFVIAFRLAAASPIIVSVTTMWQLWKRKKGQPSEPD